MMGEQTVGAAQASEGVAYACASLFCGGGVDSGTTGELHPRTREAARYVPASVPEASRGEVEPNATHNETTFD
jgi:hypothetical protein